MPKPFGAHIPADTDDTSDAGIDLASSRIAIVDRSWRIVAASEAWAGAAARPGHGAFLSIGGNYRRFCEWSLMQGVETAREMLDAIEAIERGELDNAVHDYVQVESERHEQISVSRLEMQGDWFATIQRVDTQELFDLKRERIQIGASLMRAQSQLLRVREEERRNLARELHDSSAQYLTGMNLALAYLREVAADPKLVPVLDDVGAMLDRFQREVRGLTYALHPPELGPSGLHEAIRLLCSGLAKRACLDVDLRIEGSDRKRGSAVEATVFRVIQEALINIHRHARATKVSVRLSDRPELLCITIADDGIGLGHAQDGSDAEVSPATGVGIAAMRARIAELGGSFRIRNRRRNAGTVLGAMIPRHGAGQAFLTHELEALQRQKCAAEGGMGPRNRPARRHSLRSRIRAE